MNAVLAKVRGTMKISDLQSGFQILARLPLANSQQAAIEINAFLDSLLHTPPDGEVYLQLLEQTRISLCFIGEELSRRYVNKPLPLGDPEAAPFKQVVALWLKAARAYSHCAQLQPNDDGSTAAERLALILHRCIYYTGMAIGEHHRARQELPVGVWLNLHGYYASAEEWGVATVPVADSLDSLGRSSHCTAAYVSLLLADLASPYTLSVRDLGLTRRWLCTWSPLVSLHPVLAQQSLPQSVLDLRRDCGLRTANECLEGDNSRRLDTSRLATQINQLMRQLRHRISPAQLGLGEDCTSGHCYQLLKRLRERWCTSRAARKFPRHHASGIARMATGFAAMHYHISGKGFTQPGDSSIYSRREFESLFAFRHSLDPTQLLEVHQVQLGFGLDNWEVLDQSASGFRLLRSSVGRKVELGQLLSICPHDGNTHLLAQVVWMVQEQGGSLVAGVVALPGKPRAVAARPLAPESESSAPYSRAFILPAVFAIGAEQTLVLPLGWYRPERVLEVYADAPMRVKLQSRVDGGADFERASFVIV